jgi:predicted DNA-binding ribbon-helix-helix protein
MTGGEAGPVAAPSGRPEKHSLTLRGHRTSVSLEAAFWQTFRDLAARQGKGLNELAAEIDAARPVDVGLASAIRVHLLQASRAGQV